MNEVKRHRVNQGETWFDVIRWVAPNGAIIAPTDVTTWYVVVFPVGTNSDETPLYQTSPVAPVLAPAGPWFSTLQVDGYAFDDVGYNFRYAIGPANIPTVGGQVYRYVYCANTGAWGKRVEVFEVEMVPTGITP